MKKTTSTFVKGQRARVRKIPHYIFVTCKYFRYLIIWWYRLGSEYSSVTKYPTIPLANYLLTDLCHLEQHFYTADGTGNMQLAAPIHLGKQGQNHHVEWYKEFSLHFLVFFSTIRTSQQQIHSLLVGTTAPRYTDRTGHNYTMLGKYTNTSSHYAL